LFIKRGGSKMASKDVEKRWVVILVILALVISVLGTWMTLSIVEGVARTAQPSPEPRSATLALTVLPQEVPPAAAPGGGG
jgi:hypothetical protein